MSCRASRNCCSSALALGLLTYQLARQRSTTRDCWRCFGLATPRQRPPFMTAHGTSLNEPFENTYLLRWITLP